MAQPAAKIEAVLWDIGGVLLRTESLAPRRALAERFGMTAREMEMLVYRSETGQKAQLGQASPEDVWIETARTLGLPESDGPALRVEFWGGDALDTLLLEKIRRLRRKYLTGVISNAFLNARLLSATTWKLADAFDVMVFSAEEGLLKPDAEIYRRALSRLGVQAGQAVFVDDFIENVEAAQRLGMAAIHFTGRDQALGELSALLGEKL
jgi:FMN phosphatase YigB (HAD superfamily)